MIRTMQRRISTVLYIALLAVPALVAGGLALRMLGREEGRLRLEARAAAEERVGLAAASILGAVREAQDGLADALRRLAPEERVETLRAWERDNPLVRNVFVWRPQRGLEWPEAEGARTAEEREFVRRYEPLWSGAMPWTARGTPIETADGGSVVWRSGIPARGGPGQAAALQMELRGLARPGASPARGGWIPWHSGRDLHLLGWIESPDDGAVCGVEVETMTLLSRISPALPAAAAGTAFALIDGDGRVLHQTGGLEIADPMASAASVPLAPILPHWRVAFFTGSSDAAPAAAASYRLLAGLTVVAFVLAILGGGALLLREARRQALDAAQKTSFVSNVSHELKTPLTTIRMYAEMLGEGRIADADKRRAYLDTIVGESHRLTRLVNNVLDFSRLEQHRRQYSPERLVLAEWLGALVEAHRPRCAEAGLRVETRLPDGDVGIRADRDAAEQIVLNLVDNALKYAAGGGILEVEADRGSVRVLDRGPGVPAALRERIFEKFFRIDHTLTSSVPGTGLGLSIARRLARDMGGDLTCGPRAGGGACFEWTLTPNDIEPRPRRTPPEPVPENPA
jgi:signal transduction histidine kinase